MKITSVRFELDEPVKEFWLAANQALAIEGGSSDQLYLSRNLGNIDTVPFLMWQVGSCVDVDHENTVIVNGLLSQSDEMVEEFSPHAAVSMNHPMELTLAGRAKLYICYGAGIDSTVAYNYALHMGYKREEICLINVDYGAPYSEKEIKAAKAVQQEYAKLYDGNAPIMLFVRLDDPLPCSEGNMPKGYIIPVRNALIASVVASMFGTTPDAKTIWIAANYRKIDDGTGAATDKGRRFFGEITELLSRYYSKPITVTSPFLHLSKAATMKAPWSPPVSVLEQTTTCYHATEKRCHECYACFKLAMSLKLSGRTFSDFDFKRVEEHPQFLEYLVREKAKGRKLPTDWDKRVEEHARW